MNDEYYQELLRLRDLSYVPSVRQMLEEMIKSRPQSKVQNNTIREPIKRSKAEIQTIFITKGYAWSQSPSSVSLYIPFEKADEIPKSSYFLTVLERSIELSIKCPQKGATYNFKISHLYDYVKPDNTVTKYKADKIVIILRKAQHGLEWADLRTKSTHTTYNELERHEKQYQPVTSEQMKSLFGAPTSSGLCSHHEAQKSGNTDSKASCSNKGSD